MAKLCTAFLIVSILSVGSFSDTIYIPQDYPAIQRGINAAADGDTVLADTGVYSENINFNGHNIVLCSHFLATSDSSYITATIIDGSASGSVVVFNSGEDSTAVLCGMTIRNGFNSQGGGIFCSSSSPTIKNNQVKDNVGDSGGGIFCSNSEAIILGNVISGNTFSSPLGNPGGGIFCDNGSDCLIMSNIIFENVNQDGGGICCYDSNPQIYRNLIYDNNAFDIGGGIRADNSSPAIVNNTFWGNTASYGGGISLYSGSSPVMRNNILWNNSASISGDEICIAAGSPNLSYCDIRGGWTGIGNIDENPLFADPLNGEFHLQENSPCIDAGDPNTPLDPDSTIADMGAFYFDHLTGIEIPSSQLKPESCMLFSAHPNPFNAYTTITFELPETGIISLKVYGLTGQEVRVLHATPLPAGKHSVVWNAEGMGSGVYFVRLEAGDFATTQKLLLVK